jgi:hypothetical protein
MTKRLINQYINGNCNIFALALYELNTDLSIVVKFTNFVSKGKILKVISHVWCIDNNNTYIDARGKSIDLFEDKNKANELFIKNFYEGKNSYIKNYSYEELYNWTKNFINNEKLLKKEIELAKKYILKYNFLNKIQN